MKKRVLFLSTMLLLSNITYAGGDIGKNVGIASAPVINIEEEVFPWYIGAGYGIFNYNELYANGVSADVDLKGITLLAGYQFNEYVAVEARYNKNLGGGDESWSYGFNRNNVDDKLSNVGIYVKPSYPVGDFSLYGLLGVGKFSFQYVGTAKQSDTVFQWGLGSTYMLNQKLSIFVDYVKLYDDTGFDNYTSNSDYKSDAWTIGALYKF